jgi:cell wall-associated NlpC family hydrolase
VHLNRKDIVSRARTQLGVKYHKDQYVPGLALDCVGLIRYAYDYKQGLDSRLYSTILTGTSLVDAFKALGFVATPEPQPADVIIWNYAGNPHHTGLYTQEDCCIHASAAYGKVFEHEIVGEWVDRFYCYLTLKTLPES